MGFLIFVERAFKPLDFLPQEMVARFQLADEIVLFVPFCLQI